MIKEIIEKIIDNIFKFIIELIQRIKPPHKCPYCQSSRFIELTHIIEAKGNKSLYWYTCHNKKHGEKRFSVYVQH